MKHYDYLIVGAGLFGAVFAYEMTQRENPALLLTNGTILREIFIRKISKESTSTNTARIFFILQIKKYGTM